MAKIITVHHQWRSNSTQPSIAKTVVDHITSIALVARVLEGRDAEETLAAEVGRLLDEHVASGAIATVTATRRAADADGGGDNDDELRYLIPVTTEAHWCQLIDKDGE